MIEETKGKRRLGAHRLSDMGGGKTTAHQRKPGAEQGNQRAKFNGSKRAARGPLEAVVSDQVASALKGRAMPEESRSVAESALTLAADASREIGVPSPFVVHHTTRYGVNAALAGFFTQQAAEAGFASERGLELLEAAHRCETQATRAMVAAEAAVRAFSGKRPKAIDLVSLIAEASKPRDRGPQP